MNPLFIEILIEFGFDWSTYDSYSMYSVEAYQTAVKIITPSNQVNISEKKNSLLVQVTYTDFNIGINKPWILKTIERGNRYIIKWNRIQPGFFSDN